MNIQKNTPKNLGIRLKKEIWNRFVDAYLLNRKSYSPHSFAKYLIEKALKIEGEK